MAISKGKRFNLNTPEVQAKAVAARKANLTLKEKAAIAEFIKTGNKTASFAAVYKSNKLNKNRRANTFFKKPKIANALELALKRSKFDDDYAVQTLKDIIEAGKENFDITRPDTALKALETFWKLTGKINGSKGAASGKPDLESTAKKMDMTELQKHIKELDKRQKRIMAMVTAKAEEGEVIE